MDLFGVGIYSLIIYIAAVLVISVVLKRRMAEAMLWTFIIIVVIGGMFSDKSAWTLTKDGLLDAAKQEVVYASMAFVFMAFMMERTGVINRLIQILNSILGRFAGGSGYVSTIASALFGMVSGSGSGNASAVGSITIPWMKGNGWTTARATTIVAGNAGLGIVFPPSSSMLLLLGMETIAVELTSNELYVGLMGGGMIILAYRLLVVYFYAKHDGLKPIPKDQLKPLGEELRKYSSSFIIFLGIFIPLFFTMGPVGKAIKATLNADVSGSFKSISLVMWIPILMTTFTIIEGWKYLPHSFSGWKESVISIVFIVLSFVIGANLPLILGKAAWSYITFVYIFFAAVLPMWLLKQPRDHMTTFMFMAMIVGAVVGLLVAHPTMNLPVFTGFTNEKLGTMFPILFVTVACGAVSGFHSLVSSGTSSKTVENEKDMLKVGYGAMILESLLAVLALCVAGAAAAADGTPAAGTPFQIFSRGVAGFFEMFGVPAYAATVFMTMCVSALALTSLDAVARIGRMSFQELFSVDDMEHAEGWRKLFCNVYFSTFITLVFGFILTKIGYANIWPLFGSANQLLSALVLATLCVFLKVTGRSNKMLFPPLVIMLCVTFTALVQRLIAMVKAISTAASVTIPAGETTWGAVFIANGLQLILAVLLIVLGLNIVFHSFSAYKKAEHNSEANV